MPSGVLCDSKIPFLRRPSTGVTFYVHTVICDVSALLADHDVNIFVDLFENLPCTWLRMVLRIRLRMCLPHLCVNLVVNGFF